MLQLAVTSIAGIGLGPWEIVAIVAVVLIIFGVGRLPQALGALGKGVRAFKKGSAGEEVDTDVSETKKGTAKQEEAKKEPDTTGEAKS